MSSLSFHVTKSNVENFTNLNNVQSLYHDIPSLQSSWQPEQIPIISKILYRDGLKILYCSLRKYCQNIEHKPVLITIKRRKTCTRTKIQTKIEDLPNEILFKIFSHLHFKSLGRCAQLSHRFKNIAHCPIFWETVVEKNKEIPAGFVKLAISLGCKHLHLEGCTISVINDSDYVIHKLPKDNQVKTLNLREYEASCDGLMIACRNLEKVSLSSLDFSKGQDIIFWIISIVAICEDQQMWCV